MIANKQHRDGPIPRASTSSMRPYVLNTRASTLRRTIPQAAEKQILSTSATVSNYVRSPRLFIGGRHRIYRIVVPSIHESISYPTQLRTLEGLSVTSRRPLRTHIRRCRQRRLVSAIKAEHLVSHCKVSVKTGSRKYRSLSGFSRDTGIVAAVGLSLHHRAAIHIVTVVGDLYRGTGRPLDRYFTIGHNHRISNMTMNC